jgi:hypothetical protein
MELAEAVRVGSGWRLFANPEPDDDYQRDKYPGNKTPTARWEVCVLQSRPPPRKTLRKSLRHLDQLASMVFDLLTGSEWAIIPYFIVRSREFANIRELFPRLPKTPRATLVVY